MPKKHTSPPTGITNTDPIANENHFEHVQHNVLAFKLSYDLKRTQIRIFLYLIKY